jgi:hypothetical protein
MATDFWIASGAGNWTTATGWSTGSVPGQSDDVVIGSSSSAATVTLVINTEVISTDAVTINSLKITPNDELSIHGDGGFSDFTITNGMPNGNFGTLDLETDFRVAIRRNPKIADDLHGFALQELET